MPAISPDGFKQTMRRFASGVTIVTMQRDNSIHGITVSAFMSVSLTPPLVQVCIDKNAKSHAKLAASKRYGVSILAKGQERISNHFAGFDDELEPSFDQLDAFPVIQGALGQMVCKTVNTVDAGDHTIFIGEIEHLDWSEQEPLVYFDGKYRDLADLA